MILCITVIRENVNENDGGVRRGEVVTLGRVTPAQRDALPPCNVINFAHIYVDNVPGEEFRRLRRRLLRPDRDETTTPTTRYNRREWRVRFPDIPAPIRSQLLNPPYAEVVGWEPFKGWLEHRRLDVVDAETITDADLVDD